MRTLTMSLIGALIVGSFMIFQDYETVPPYGQFTLSKFFYIGSIIVIGSVIGFVILIIKRKSKKTTER